MRTAACVLLLSLGAGGAAGCGGERSAPTTGTIRGVCRLAGEMTPQMIRVPPGMACAEDHRSDRVVAEERALADCLVSIEPGPQGGEWPKGMDGATRVAWIDIRLSRFLPHVSWIRAGTQLAFRSHDPCEHNVHGYRDSIAVTAFNFALPANREVPDLEAAYVEPAGTILLKDDGHMWMNGTIHVVDHPWHDLTTLDRRAGKEPGEYVFANVPAGEHEVICRHESLLGDPVRSGGKVAAYTYGPEIRLVRKVTVRPGETAEVDFEIPIPHPR